MVNIKNDTGNISISNDVLSNLAGEAATACFGVKGMVACSKEGGPWQILRRETMSKGIVLHYEENGSVSVEMHIGVDRGVNISAVCRSIIKEVGYKLSRTAGVAINSVDVFVDTIIG